jgi:GT2 family glycosyltransferase
MRVLLVTIGYNLPGATARLLDSARQSCRSELVFLIISHTQMPEKIDELERLAQRPDVIYRSYGVNRGLSKSWNEGMLWGHEQGFDVTVVVNEDVVLASGDVDRLATTAIHRRDAPLVMGRAYHHSERAWAWSEYGCFAVNPVLLETLGCFDENFFPIYCEDSDLRRRLKLAGLAPAYCAETRIVHGGSRSLGQPEVSRQNSLTYARNRRYYQRKWGGEGGAERLERPFGDPRFTYYIAPGVRDAPYAGFNRTDQAIVQI